MTAAKTTKQVTALNRMNRAAQNVSLGTMLQNLGTVSTGSYTVTDANANASRVEVPTGLSSVGGFVVTPTRSGSPLTLKVTAGSVVGSIIVENTAIVTTVTGGSKVALNDVISYVAFK